jgi:hypothetical protein
MSGESDAPQRLSFPEAVELLRERTGYSVGWARAELRAVLDEVPCRIRHERTIVLDPVPLTADDGIVGMDMRPGAMASRQVAPRQQVDKPPRYNCSRINRADFVYWLDQTHPAGPKAAPQVSEPKPETTNRAGPERIKEIVTHYCEQLGGDRPAMDRAEQFARDEYGIVGHRGEVRAAYVRQFPNQKVGRARKNSAK